MPGAVPGKRPKGVIWILYGNATGFDGQFSYKSKVEKANTIHDDLKADIVAYKEHFLNLKHKLNKVGFNQLFGGGEAKV